MNDTTQLTTQTQLGRTTVAKQPGEQSVARQAHLAPPVDIFESRQGITLFADLLGVSRGKPDVRIQGGTPMVGAELMVPTPQGLRLRHGEARHPHFLRTFVLNPNFDASRTDAQLRDEVLKSAIPCRNEAKPRCIEVQVD